MRFGTRSIPLILAGIVRGLRLAAELEEKLGGSPAGQSPARTAAAALALRRPRAPRPKSPPRAKLPATPHPTAKQIAAWVRQYPVETVLFHIRSELGLVPSDPLWQEVEEILIERCGELIPKKQDTGERAAPVRSLPPRNPLMPPAPLWQLAPHLVSVATIATGPP